MTKPAIFLAHVDEVEPLGMDEVRAIAAAAVAEVLKQDNYARSGRFGGTHILPSGPDAARLSVLVEEVGGVAREVNQAFEGKDTAADLIKELIQVAACAIAWAAAVRAE